METFEKRSTSRCLWPGVELNLTTENIAPATEWSIYENRLALIIHLGGMLRQLEIELDGQRSALPPIGRGEFLLIPPATRYECSARGGKVRYAELYFDPKQLATITRINSSAVYFSPRIAHFDEFFLRSVLYLERLAGHSDDLAKMSTQIIIDSITLHLMREYAESTAGNQDKSLAGFDSATRQRLTEYIDANLGNTIRLTDLARVGYVTAHDLLKLFRKSFGVTPMQFIVEQRLVRVRSLLSHTEKDITTIALETGFASHSHLTNTFKIRNGLTPREFRQMQRRP